jgi:hypothetical protein
LFVFDPLLQYCKLFEFNMVGVLGGLLGICHKSGTIVVLMNDGGEELIHT